MKLKFAVGILLAVSFLLAFGCPGSGSGYEKKEYIIMPANVLVSLEVANTPDKLARGMMFREFLGEREGMVFLLGKNEYQGFWMYNTKLPLEILFLDEEMRVVDIQEMEPCVSKNPNECRNYVSRGKAAYAIELNANFSKKYGVKIGDGIAQK